MRKFRLGHLHCNCKSIRPSFTAELDLLAARDKTNLADLTTRKSVRDAFMNAYAPILADNLVAELDDEPVIFQCVKWRHGMEERGGRYFVFGAGLRLLWTASTNFSVVHGPVFEP